LDEAGDLYGTTAGAGGRHDNPGYGVVFELAPNPSGHWTYAGLRYFCQQNCVAGAGPLAGLIMDQAGNLYGTTFAGGANNRGVVFEFTPSFSGGWTETVLYSFCLRSGCPDGSGPAFGSLIIDKVGNLYGTTFYGGAHGAGVAFQLTPKHSGPWIETVLYSFCSQKGCSDGAGPEAVLMDEAGNLYGTTGQGGNTASGLCKDSNPPGCGVAFELSPNRSGGWTETVLHTFCSESNRLDGDGPISGLIMDEAGNLYGTTVGGGNGNNICDVSSTCGLVFELTPNRSDGWSETVLYYFCSQSKCSDGANPDAGLLMDGAGNLYGATDSGANYSGVVYALTPGRNDVWKETVLHDFCSQTGCADGYLPFAGLIMDKTGNLYGTTEEGGTGGGGVAFKISGAGAQPDMLSVAKSGKGSGTVTSSPPGIGCGSTCRANFNSGARVTLTASAASGSIFAGWSGGGCGGTDPCIVTMNSSRRVTASFVPASSHTLSLALLGGGAVVSSPSGISCPVACSASFAPGTRVTLTATPASGYSFDGWSGNSACSSTGSCMLTMNSNRSVTARFSVITYSLSASLAGSGTVTSSPSGINCPRGCSASFNHGTQVTLTATPASGWSFNGWGGNSTCAGTGGTCTLTMNSDQSVTTRFSAVTYSLSVATVGGGAVASSPPGIDCPGACGASFDAGTRVTLTAAPVAGWIFSGWSNACSATATCLLTMNSDQSVGATFEAGTP
jgi:uncharacterized repeat protein (TIGR03803 family)